MSYTDYGLYEGLTMLIFPLIVITVAFLIRQYDVSKPQQRKLRLIYALILTMMTLDTLMWAFDIQTNVIDFLVTSSNGAQEQITIFTVGMYILIVYMMMTKDRTAVNHTDVKDESS